MAMQIWLLTDLCYLLGHCSEPHPESSSMKKRFSIDLVYHTLAVLEKVRSISINTFVTTSRDLANQSCTTRKLHILCKLHKCIVGLAVVWTKHLLKEARNRNSQTWETLSLATCHSQERNNQIESSKREYSKIPYAMKQMCWMLALIAFSNFSAQKFFLVTSNYLFPFPRAKF